MYFIVESETEVVARLRRIVPLIGKMDALYAQMNEILDSSR